MKRVACEIEHMTDITERGYEADCVYAVCTQCGNQTKSWGAGAASVKRCLALMREECEQGERNFYYDEIDD